MQRLFNRQMIYLVGVALSLYLLGAASSAKATAIMGESSAFGVYVDLSVSLVGQEMVTAGIGPLPTRTGLAPAPYNEAGSLANASVTGTLLGINVINFNTGLLEVGAQSNVDGTPGGRTTGAQSTVNTITTDIVSIGLLGGTSSLFHLDATTIESTAEVSGDFGNLTPFGTSIIEDLNLAVLGVDISLGAAFAPNTNLVINSGLVPGLTGNIGLFLNEQIASGDMQTDQSLEVNALRLSFDNVGIGLGALGVGALNGDIIIAHAEASQMTAAVPEPSTLTLFLIGTAGLACLGWHRQRKRPVDISSQTLAM